MTETVTKSQTSTDDGYRKDVIAVCWGIKPRLTYTVHLRFVNYLPVFACNCEQWDHTLIGIGYMYNSTCMKFLLRNVRRYYSYDRPITI